MKNVALLTVLIFTFSFISEKKENPESDSNIVTNFLHDVTSMETAVGDNPITNFQDSAKEVANKIVPLSKDNIQDLLTEMKEFKHCVITTGDHTIIKIIDLDDCKQSGSWATCMPMAEGYIKKGKLAYKKDYMNYIIGIPDAQSRTAYLFDPL